MQLTALQMAAIPLPLILAIVFHEVSHGAVARLLGDPTAHAAGRLTLNPLRHVDPVGTLLVPGFLALVHAPVFGWARPVPVNKRRLNHPRRDMMLVAAAGPGSNLVLAAISAVLFGLLARFLPEEGGGVSEFAAFSLTLFIQFNVFLALFNLLPVPPFDGSHIVEGLLPPPAARVYARARPFGLGLMFLLLLGVPYIFPDWNIIERVVVPPFLWVMEQFFTLAQVVAGLTG
ncbi:site-2 protease family protein [Novosphingobium sp. BW1]|uniref:site-2 protease family protein n=1 Tax=Novosphingobium sp. BW1 TaxID=2592621 RepID=UPI0011DEA65F|nr:site-2 protease family protein [Novosphingobium sp. BW1]TYC91875.1 site-2 protease family protein [Novosphingobium sp. BW1]